MFDSVDIIGITAAEINRLADNGQTDDLRRLIETLRILADGAEILLSSIT